ncbi:MAG: ArsR/SmtB family transcription factor, partial [Candidatus Geothermarchaeales archaeon]
MFELTEEDETYSTIFKALKHPIRRGIMRMLRGDGVAYSEMLEALGIESGHLKYHLEAMRDLISKTEEGRYRLSSLGRAALGLMEGVEEPRRETMKLAGYRRKMLVLSSLLVIVSLLFGGIGLHYYLESGSLRSELDQLRSEYITYDQFGNEYITIITPVGKGVET